MTKTLPTFVAVVWTVGLLMSARIAPRFIPETLYLGKRNNFDERLPARIVDIRLPKVFWMWANSDGNHYLSIARDGYYSYEHGFFPLYPLLINVVHHLTKFPWAISALSVTYLSLLFFIKMFIKLLSLDFSRNQIDGIIQLIVVLPIGFFLLSTYNDSLFLLLTVLSLYSARKSHWTWAGCFGGLATLTRFPGLAIFPALLVERFTARRKDRLSLIAPFFVPAGFALYLLYIQIIHGDWRLFTQSMGVWSQNKYVIPFQTVYRYVKILSTGDLSFVYLIALLEILAVILTVYLTLWGWKKIRPSYLAYAISYMMIPMSSGTFQGMPRYFLHAFPFVLLLSQRLSTRVKRVILPLSLGLEFLLFGFFSQGHFVS